MMITLKRFVLSSTTVRRRAYALILILALLGFMHAQGKYVTTYVRTAYNGLSARRQNRVCFRT